MHAAVEHVEVRNRQAWGDAGRGEPLPQRRIRGRGQRAGQRHRHADGGVRAEPALVRGAVEADHRLVRVGQRVPGPAAQQVRDLAVDVARRIEDAAAFVARLVAVAELYRLAGSGGRSRRNPGLRLGTVRQGYGDGQRRPPPRVEDLQCGHPSHVERCHDRVSSLAGRPGAAFSIVPFCSAAGQGRRALVSGDGSLSGVPPSRDRALTDRGRASGYASQHHPFGKRFKHFFRTDSGFTSPPAPLVTTGRRWRRAARGRSPRVRRRPGQCPRARRAIRAVR